MVRNPRPAREQRRSRWTARIGAVAALVGALTLALPTMATLAQDAPSPSLVASDAPVDLDRTSRPVRVQVPFAGIDLPVVSSDRNVSGNVRGYPLCDVAQYWTRYDMPGAPGTTWLFAHAQPDMFLPLFTISEVTDGKGLVGKLVKLQLRDGRLLTYRITEVRERATGQGIARRGNPRQHRLILQTSTGPSGTVPKLQVAARLIDAERTTEKPPKAQPRACWQPKPTPTPRNSKRKPRATPVPVVIEPEQSPDAMTLLLGSAAVLLGATIVAVYVVRRP